ncbi:fluoride efflux transporter FluC [Domibacillus indicus]|uniref:fluoride efflux transporter FluC n=1 Tax=Domibacillus indicus TaxID=1437523 RepID=UPI000617FC01|nr:CrcB family protein [Domibacillus indicus]
MIFAAIGGFFGAITRFWISGLFNKAAFPFGTLFVNLAGAFLLGLLIERGIRESSLLLWGTGFLGAFTTFSTWMFEIHEMSAKKAAFYAVLTCLPGFFGAWLGMRVV